MRARTFLQPTNDSPTFNLSIGVKIVEIKATISFGSFVSVSSLLVLPIYGDQTDTTSEIDESGLVYVSKQNVNFPDSSMLTSCVMML